MGLHLSGVQISIPQPQKLLKVKYTHDTQRNTINHTFLFLSGVVRFALSEGTQLAIVGRLLCGRAWSICKDWWRSAAVENDGYLTTRCHAKLLGIPRRHLWADAAAEVK